MFHGEGNTFICQTSRIHTCNGFWQVNTEGKQNCLFTRKLYRRGHQLNLSKGKNVSKQTLWELEIMLSSSTYSSGSQEANKNAEFKTQYNSRPAEIIKWCLLHLIDELRRQPLRQSTSVLLSAPGNDPPGRWKDWWLVHGAHRVELENNPIL